MSGRWPMLWVGALSLLVSATMILSHQPYRPAYDSADYAYLASRMLDGHGYTRSPGEKPTAERAPLYPLFLAGVFEATGRSLRAAQLATALLGALAAMLVFALAFELWGRQAALWAGGLAAVLPPWVAASAGLFTEPLFLALELAALLVALVFRRRPRGSRLPLLLGLLCGLAALARSNGLLMLVVLAPAIALAAPDRRTGIKAAAVTLAAASLTLAPWAVRNAAQFDRFIPTTTQSGYSLISVFNDKSRGSNGDYRLVGPRDVGVPLPDGARTDEAAYGQELVRASRRYAADHPLYVGKVAVLNTLRTLELWKGASTGFVSFGANGLPDSRFWRLLVPSSFLLYAMALAGLVVVVRDRTLTRPPVFVYALPVLLLVTSAFAAGALRYRLPFDPLLLVFAGVGLATFGRAVGSRRATSA